HSIWLTMMRDRLLIIRELLSNSGSIWIHLDDIESHYCKVVMDEIFGRKNFVNTIIWQKKHTRSNDARWLSDNHDFILVYAKDKQNWKRNLLPRTEAADKGYTNLDDDPRGVWASGPCHAKTPNLKDIYPIKTPSGRKIMPPPGTSWRFSKQNFQKLIRDNRIYFGPSGNNVPRYKRFLSEVKKGLVPLTIWLKDEVGDNQEAKKEAKTFNDREIFTTPKPERLMQRIIEISTNRGDWVLDSFSGSGTTGAVAHKMGRKWIMVELGEHAETHCLKRLHKVVKGIDNGGISKSVGWKGGGGFKYCVLGESLFKFDPQLKFPFINTTYTNGPLIRAVCKMDGFRVISTNGPLHGQVNKRYAHITEQFVNQIYIEQLEKEITTDESLVIYCLKHDSKIKEPENISVKRMPMALAKRFTMGW
ncbi:MAG: site-specific DNA-methyltransferase, partial [Candidatus Omnitrophica bacterium]|nr:site-specific DNA-methyltransferase [Candidatus Omnitrophota bacterium]